MQPLGNAWDTLLSAETQKDYYKKLKAFLVEEYRTHTIYPTMENIYATFREVAPERVKVVILGQDPYHQPGQAHGMAFSVLPGVRKPPSLANIYKEIEADIGCKMSDSGYLMPWARQGVFLLNACLTVRNGQANSHKGKGWEILTDAVISYLNAHASPKVFLLWGRGARNKRVLIDAPQHLVLEAAHPSPLSAYNGFFGCRHFSRANDYLLKNQLQPINWQV